MIETGKRGVPVPQTGGGGAGLPERYREVMDRAAAATRRAGRDPAQTVVVAVTKFATMEAIRELMDLGHRDFGENKAQQLTQRAAMIDESVRRLQTLHRSAAAPAPQMPRWHMIGHLQRNKAKKVVECTRLIHSVDSMRLAEELQTVGLKRETPVEVLLQVNVSGEESKFGCPISAVEAIADAIESMAYVRVRGLMTIAPISDNPEDSRPHFIRLREVFEEMVLAGYGEGRFNILSMGMSGDYEIALEEGANMVRVGSAIFGPGPVEDEDHDEE
jgi:hypothetical protein